MDATDWNDAAIAASIRERAIQLGFDRVGFCDARVPPEASHFSGWLARGLHAGMGWLERDSARRLDPQRVLPGARSFVMVAMAYASPTLAGPGAPPPAPLRGLVARYARGDDYHQVMGGRLAQLEAFIEDRAPGHRALAYVDTGPLLERMWAARAGIGWVGKNGLVLNEEMGSLFLLGLVITTLSLPADRPVTDRCGHCTLCLDACPTGAIVSPRVVDSRLCISYHTIEKRGALTAEEREAAGGRLFGCDDCQDACPWNQQAGAAGGPEPRSPLGIRPETSEASLLDLLRMTHEDYLARFRGSAMKRATFTGLKRNAALALAHAADGPERRQAMELLETCSSDPGQDPVVREQAAWSLARLSADQEQPHPPGRPQPPGPGSPPPPEPRDPPLDPP